LAQLSNKGGNVHQSPYVKNFQNREKEEDNEYGDAKD
jgi:hypothetical protein